jgi:NAD(P)-dependent dehydrogenase (short-subunit alcohol dehydrogenase family)
MERMGRVDGKVVLVSGAGSGIGRATATLLAAEGATVIVIDINRASGLETVQQIGGRTSGGGARFEEHDASREADWKRIIDGILEREGRLNGLVNNAGIAGPFPATFETETLEHWRRMLSVNVEGVFLGCKHGVPALSEKARDRTRRRIPIGEFGAPDDIAYGILYLISDESRFVTGAELVIDGGMNAI